MRPYIRSNQNEKNMSNLDQIIANTQSQCISTEILYPQSSLRSFEKSWGSYALTQTQHEMKIGIEGSKCQWSWFYVSNPFTDSEFISYDQTYSQKTGKSRRAWRTGSELIRKFSK